MGKRRTKKEKAGAKHTFLYSSVSEPKIESPEANVKGQFENGLKANNPLPRDLKKANLMVKTYDLASVKHDILRSLIIASLILGMELMIYLAWNV